MLRIVYVKTLNVFKISPLEVTHQIRCCGLHIAMIFLSFTVKGKRRDVLNNKLLECSVALAEMLTAYSDDKQYPTLNHRSITRLFSNISVPTHLLVTTTNDEAVHKKKTIHPPCFRFTCGLSFILISSPIFRYRILKLVSQNFH